MNTTQKIQGPELQGKMEEEEEDLFMRLPEDVLIDIASRVSSKDACRFKCLSKSWLSLLSSNPDFKKLHRLRAPQRPPIVILADVITVRNRPRLFIEGSSLAPPAGESTIQGCFGASKLVFNFTSEYREEITEFAQSCRDLMCFYNWRIVYVYSPSTTQFLHFDCNPGVEPYQFKVGIVYIDSLKVYKIVKIVLHEETSTIRFEAITIQEDDTGERGELTGTSWEFISEHTLPFTARHLRNSIGINSVIYSIAIISPPRVVSLDLDEHKKHQQFKIINFPQVCNDACRWCTGITLSKVKDQLCIPHITKSTIDLWLLQDRNSGLWSKGFSINFIRPEPVYGCAREVVYFHQPTTINDAAGLFFFQFDWKFYRYDISTEEVVKLSRENLDLPKLHVFTDNLFSLKNSSVCDRLPAKWQESELKTRKPRPPPPAGTNTTTTTKLPVKARSSTTSRCGTTTSVLPSRLAQLKMTMPLPPPHPPLPQILPPLQQPQPQPYYPHNIYSPIPNLTMPNPTPHQGSPRYAPPYYPHNLQHSLYSSMVPLPQNLPASHYYPHSIQNDMYSPELKRRKIHSLQPLVPLPPYEPCTSQSGTYTSDLRGRNPLHLLARDCLPQPLPLQPQLSMHTPLEARTRTTTSTFTTTATTATTLPSQLAVQHIFTTAQDENTVSSAAARLPPPPPPQH